MPRFPVRELTFFAPRHIIILAATGPRNCAESGKETVAMKQDAENYIADIARLLEGSIRFAFSHSTSALPDKND